MGTSTSGAEEKYRLPLTCRRDVDYSEKSETGCLFLVGTPSAALAHSLRIIEPDLKNPRTAHRARTFQIL